MSPLERLGHWIVRHRRRVFVAWGLLFVFGMFAASKVSDRWDESFSIPGRSAYEANQRTLDALGTGERAPFAVVLTSEGDVTSEPGVNRAIEAVAKASPGARVSSYFDSHDPVYVSADGHTMFADVYPAGQVVFDTKSEVDAARTALRQATPAGASSHLTGSDALYLASGDSSDTGIALEVAVAALGALIILLFVFGTAPAVLIPLVTAACSILTTFSLIWGMTYITDVSIIVQFLIALIGLGIAIDYALLMIFRYREELARGEDPETALVETMTHAGRSVVISGSTVAIGLVSMVILPLPFIRSIGIAGLLIPLVSVVTALTLLPALLSWFGPRINRFRVMPKRFAHAGDPDSGAWARWAARIIRRPALGFLAGSVLVALVLIPAFQLHIGDAQAGDFPGKGDAIDGRQALADAAITPAAISPFQVVVEGNADRATLDAVATGLDDTDGIAGAATPPDARSGNLALVEGFTADDPASDPGQDALDRVDHDALPALRSELGSGARLTLAGYEPEQGDFVDAVYGNFPIVLALVLALTYLLLARAFRSLVLALKAVILNVISLGAAYGIIVFVFQQGHGSEAIWNVAATGVIVSWIPLMIFAFLFGMSMDYEVFMLTRMRETYDEVHDTDQAIALGLARTGKLVTSAALILMLAFFALSTGPGLDIKQFGIGLAAGIIFDATVIRALLVPSLMCLLGRYNWYFPAPAARLLFVRGKPAPETG